jgi:hypothetical protein
MQFLKRANMHKLLYEKTFSFEETDRLRAKKYDFSLLAVYKSIFLQSAGAFYPSKKPFQSFKPIKNLQNIIDTYVANFSSNTIGVHIRRTDHSTSVRYSPTKEFIKIMKVEIEKNNSAQFFLATDSASTEEKVKKEFPGKVMVYPKNSLDRDTPEAIKGALVDLYCLSMTNKLIGSFGSTFTNTAARINSLKTTIVCTKEKNSN